MAIAIVTKVTDDNRDDLVTLAMSAYLDEGCKYCDKVYGTIEDLKKTVWAGCHSKGRLACQECWDKHTKKPEGGA